MTIPVLKPSIGQDEIDAVVEVLKSGWLGLGPKTEEFERKFAEFIGCNYAIALNSGTAALHLALAALGIKEGDEVIVTTMTFVSTVHAIRYIGATPVFSDIEKDTMNIDPDDIERKITNKTKAIMVVHMAGHPCNMDRINKIGENNGLHIIEDAAHACGAKHKGKRIGDTDNLTCFSFHAVKNLTCGEGGAIISNHEWYNRFFKEMRWVGISKDTWIRTAGEKVYAWQYWIDKVGYKYHMSDINAAIGLVQLQKLDQLNHKRKSIATNYSKEFSNLAWIELPKEKDYAESSWHLYQIKLPDQNTRDRLVGYLKEKDISPGVHYMPIHLQPCYRDSKACVPVAGEIWKRILTLPVYPDMTQEELDQVIDAVRNFK